MGHKRLSTRRVIKATLKGQRLHDPSIFLSPRRIDIAAKTIFARAYVENNTSGWPELVYKEHIRAFNNFIEAEPQKKGYEDFRNSFIKTIEGVKNNNSWKHRAPVYVNKTYLVNGAHRVAASIALNDKVNTQVPKEIYDDTYNYDFFMRNKNGLMGINDDVLDYMTVEYVSLKNKDVFVAIIFPTAEGYRQEAYEHLVGLGEIVNMRNFKHNEFIGKEVIKQLYFNSNNDEWNYGLDFESAQHKADLCFDGEGDLQVYVIEANLNESTRVKEKQYLRKLWNKDKHSIHITDTIEEANRVVRMFFHDNSRNFMKIDRKQEFNSQEMYDMFYEYMRLAPKDMMEREKIAIEGSAVLDLLNIRSGRDIDYISRDDRINFASKNIEKHNPEENGYHSHGIDEILTNPKYYFYYKGYKFVDIDELKKYKQNRLKRSGDKKDADDIELINNFLKHNTMRSKTPLVTIIMPVYNTPKEYLFECFESVRSQTYNNLEIIIVDDGSNKQVAGSIDKYVSGLKQDKDTRWKVIHQKNKGLASARNTGYRIAEGKYIQFLDADDFFDKRLIQTAVTKAEKLDAEVVVENFTARDYATNEERIILRKNQFPEKDTFSLNELTGTKVETIPYNVWSKLFRKDFLDKYGVRHDEELARAEDLLFSYTALLRAQKIAVVLEPYILYRENLPGSNSETNDKFPTASVEAWDRLYQFISKNNLYSTFRDDYEAAMLNSLQWHFERLYTQESKTKLAIAATILFEKVEVKAEHEFRAIVQLALAGPEALASFEAMSSQAKQQMDSREVVENHLRELETRLHHLEQPGIKLAARKLAGAIKRKLLKNLKPK